MYRRPRPTRKGIPLRLSVPKSCWNWTLVMRMEGTEKGRGQRGKVGEQGAAMMVQWASICNVPV